MFIYSNKFYWEIIKSFSKYNILLQCRKMSYLKSFMAVLFSFYFILFNLFYSIYSIYFIKKENARNIAYLREI